MRKSREANYSRDGNYPAQIIVDDVVIAEHEPTLLSSNETDPMQVKTNLDE